MIQGVYPGVTTSELDELAAQTSAYMSTQHPDFSKLAARISVSNLHKQTEKVRWTHKVRYSICSQVHVFVAVRLEPALRPVATKRERVVRRKESFECPWVSIPKYKSRRMSREECFAGGSAPSLVFFFLSRPMSAHSRALPANGCRCWRQGFC